MQQLQQELRVRESSWPALEDPCTRWQGVQCEGDHVKSILLSDLPRQSNETMHVYLDVIQGLPNLRELNASGFPLRRPIPDSFTSLRALQVLDLTATVIDGGIPTTLGNLSSLRFLSLASNELTGSIPESIGNLVNLVSLNLSFNRLLGPIPSGLFNATGLVNIDLSHNNLTGHLPPAVGRLAMSQSLVVSNNELTGSLPSQLGNLTFLKQLDLSHNLFSGAIPPDLGKLRNLDVLTLETNNLSGKFPPEISQCTSLRIFNMRQNQVEGVLSEAIGDLRKLVTLDASSNRMTGLLPSGVGTFVLLQTLDIAHNYFYGSIPELFGTLQNIQSLNLSNNFFNGSLPVGLIPNAVLKKNCLTSSPGQHAPRTCFKFYARHGVIFGEHASSPDSAPQTPILFLPPPSPTSEATTKHLVPILAGTLGGVVLIVVIASLAVCFHLCEKKPKNLDASGRTHGSVGSARGGSARVSAAAVPTNRMGEVFSYAQLQQATNNYASENLICNGHSGDLYKGLLESGAMVAVKRIDLTKVRTQSYLQELEVLGRASHTRLVLLLGHCLDRDEEKFLVYKYTPNGTLASALHKKSSPRPYEDGLQSLDWITRLKIAIGVAEALSYLHSECSPPIVHRDVKASSILLDDKFEVRLGSLSDARVQDGNSHPSRRITRWLGLSQPSDSGDSGLGFSTSSDVYSFGEVLMELVSGKLGISGTKTDPESEAWLEWALPLINVHDKESLPKLVDPSLIVDEDLLGEVWAIAIIARACLHTKPHKRPSMRHVLKALENPHKVVREEHFGESFRRNEMRTSSHSSWNEALFGSWRYHHSKDAAVTSLREDGYHCTLSVAKSCGMASSSAPPHARRGSSDTAPEPTEEDPHDML